SALLHDPAMADLVARRGVPVVLMHMKGDPKTMQVSPSYADCPAEVRAFLLEAALRAQCAGVDRRMVILDPGIGFGKRLEDNLALIARLGELAAEGYPVLVGLSRKAFVGAVTGRAVEDRLSGSLGAACAAFLGGARIFRAHDPAQTADALAVFSAALAGGEA
ncbi:MAG: dihydropteroate synthase, partial [Spirochaetaceae bacterium]|nr:dihydropteroate synthase [Spirochaetaceae bacterium]